MSGPRQDNAGQFQINTMSQPVRCQSQTQVPDDISSLDPRMSGVKSSGGAVT